MSGNLIVRPLSARLTHGTELFGKMDPLVKVIVGSHVQRTPAMKRGHKNPTWDTELSLRRTNEDIIRFEVWDKDILTKNDLIGAGELPFARVFALNGMFKDWIPLTYKNKSAGELLVSLEFIPDYGVNLNDESSRIGTMTGPTMGTMGTSNMPLQNTQNLGVVNTQPLMTSQIPNEYMASTQPITQPIVSPQMMTSTTQTMQPLAGTQGNLPLSSERGFAPNSLPTGQVFTDPLDSLERARERDEGFMPGGIGRKEERLEQAGHKDEKFFDRTRDNIDRHMDRNLERRDPYLQENLRTTEVRPGENYYGRGSFIPDQYRLQQEQYRAEMIRSQSAMPGYSNGIVGYHPVSSSDGRWIYEPRIDERAFDRIEERGFDRMPLQQQDFTRQQATIQQIPMQQNYTQQPLMSQQFQGQPQYGYTQQENVHPSLRQDLTNIENRIKDKAHEMRPLHTSNYDNPLARNKTGYQREQREYVPILPESKMSTIPQSQTITTQLPGVISNPESRYEGGKFVTHQGGTHSTVGSVQSHRIISRMADKPDQGINALDEDARIALGDVPRSYYGDKGTTTTK